MIILRTVIAALTLLALGGCSSGAAQPPSPGTAPRNGTTKGNDGAGSGTATITIGDREWTFTELSCEGTLETEFRLVGGLDDLRLGLFSSPDLGVLELLSSDMTRINFASPGDPEVHLEGKHVAVSTEMTDWSGESPTMDKVAGTLDARCP